ncbi:hypothetical protein K8R47_01820 [archaeon]|nr:hypothetical protein [archaeon]
MAEDKFDVKKEYQKLRYKLPNFEDLNNEFELEFIKEKGFLLRQIRRRLNEKVIFYARIIESLLYPIQNSIINMHEIKFFSKEEKEEIEKIYKKIMAIERESLYLDVNYSDQKDVDFINKIFKEWNELRKNLTKITEKMKDSWNKELKRESNNYFG